MTSSRFGYSEIGELRKTTMAVPGSYQGERLLRSFFTLILEGTHKVLSKETVFSFPNDVRSLKGEIILGAWAEKKGENFHNCVLGWRLPSRFDKYWKVWNIEGRPVDWSTISVDFDGKRCVPITGPKYSTNSRKVGF